MYENKRDNSFKSNFPLYLCILILLLCITYFGIMFLPSFIDDSETVVSTATHGLDPQVEAYIAQRDKDFKNPPAKYRVVDLITGRRLDIAEMQSKNMGGPIASVNWSSDYPNNQLGWVALNSDLARVEKADMVAWIWDEKGYPSGAVGGLAAEGNPEYEARGVYNIVVEGEGTGYNEVTLPSDSENFLSAVLYPFNGSVINLEKGILANFTDTQVTTNGIDGKWQLWIATEKIMFEGSHAHTMRTQFNATGRYPNLMDRDAVRRLIDVTHEKYKSELDNFSSRVHTFLSGEPSLMTHWTTDYNQRPSGIAYFPWERTIPEKFKEKFGYDLIPVLPYLLGGEGEINKRVRYHYYTIVGDLMTENYARQLTEWAEGNGVKASAYYFCEEHISLHVSLYGNLMQTLGEFTIPGSDIPIMPNEKFDHGRLLGIKYASSAARLKNKYEVLAFMDPLLGGMYEPNSNFYISSDVLIRNLNMIFHYGANSIGTYGHHSASGAANYAEFNNYAGRLSVMLRNAVDKAQTAIYYPIETFQGRYIPTHKNVHHEPAGFSDIEGPQKELINMLATQSVDFNYIDANAILNATIKGSSLVINNYEYKVIIMPAVELIELSVVEKLNSFEESGGKVIYYKTLPSIAGKANDTNALKNAVSDKVILNEQVRVVSTVKDAIEDKVTIQPSSNILYSQYLKDTRHLVFLFNIGEPSQTITISIEDATKGRILDPETGEIKDVSLPHALDVNGYKGMFVEVIE